MAAREPDPAAIEARRQACRRGGQARAAQFTSEYQSSVRGHVRRESLVAAGARGQAASRQKYGPHFAARRLSAWRRDRPTALITIVCGWLDESWRLYQANDDELVPGRAYADIVTQMDDGHRVDIECDGQHWHELNDHVGEDRPAMDEQRDDQVRAAGFVVLRLSEAEIRDGSGRERMLRFLFGPKEGGNE